MNPRSVLITGANRGIGLEFVRQIVKLPDPPTHVFSACRNPETAQDLMKLAAEHPSVKLLKIDVGDETSINAAVDEVSQTVGEEGLNILINNAGAMHRSGLEDTKAKDMMYLFQINAVGPMLMVQKCLPLLRKAISHSGVKKMSMSRASIVNITSLMGSIEDASTGRYPYRASKVALNMITHVMANDLKDDGIMVALLHPGWVKTDMGGPNAKITTEQSVEGMLSVISNFTESQLGQFLNYDGSARPW